MKKWVLDEKKAGFDPCFELKYAASFADEQPLRRDGRAVVARSGGVITTTSLAEAKTVIVQIPELVFKDQWMH